VELARQMLSVLFVFALLGAVIVALRKGPLLIKRAGPRKLESVDRIALTPQHALHVVKVGGREVVVATHPQGCTVLEQLRESGS
jgi:flagellar biogenesis protein FliO